MQDRPTVCELLDAAEDFLRNDLRGRLEGRDAFHVLVTANVLGIVKRELDSFESANAAETERLRALLGADAEVGLIELNRELCRRIRAGELAVGDERLVDHLIRTTLTRIAVDNPRYPGYRAALRHWPQHAPAEAAPFDTRR